MGQDQKFSRGRALNSSNFQRWKWDARPISKSRLSLPPPFHRFASTRNETLSKPAEEDAFLLGSRDPLFPHRETVAVQEFTDIQRSVAVREK